MHEFKSLIFELLLFFFHTGYHKIEKNRRHHKIFVICGFVLLLLMFFSLSKQQTIDLRGFSECENKEWIEAHLYHFWPQKIFGYSLNRSSLSPAPTAQISVCAISLGFYHLSYLASHFLSCSRSTLEWELCSWNTGHLYYIIITMNTITRLSTLSKRGKELG